MSQNKEYFHFTIGPVQGFVAQARRTRDFWAGSFILSWLSSVAMKAVVEQTGNEKAIQFPKPDVAFMKAIVTGSSNAKQGNVPNRFKAEVSENFDPELVVRAVKAAWEGLADAVWCYDFQNLGLDESKTKKIWSRQVQGFWDIQWALVESDTESNTLDRMKNWRTYLPPNEPGQKCMLMSGWQELSGVESPGRYKGSGQGAAAFWKALREQPVTGIKTDLREGEQLCALAYIKRRFSRVFKGLSIPMPKGADWVVKGWEIPSNVPSVQYLAAVPWIKDVLQKAKDNPALAEQIKSFHDVAHALTGEHGEQASGIKCIKEVVGNDKSLDDFAALDGGVFFESVLQNPNAWNDEDLIDADLVLHELKKLQKVASVDPVSPFYAVLLMDGDQLGKQMSDPKKQEGITLGLSEFTAGVGQVVDDHSGFLIYAGGDDVLAILPLEYALSCAAKLRRFYNDCFAKYQGITTSISAAIQYTNIKMPLGSVLSDAHDLLDNVAKDAKGRDAIACRVWKPGGLQLQWAMPWREALEGGESDTVSLDTIADKFRAQSIEGEDDQGQFASKFFYRIRERFAVLNPVANATGETVGVFNNEDGFEKAVSLMAMEYINSGESSVTSMDSAREIVRPLMKQCQHVVRVMDEDGSVELSVDQEKGFNADGALLVRFLARKGIER